MGVPKPTVGNQMKLYLNTGDEITPVWVELDEVGDVAVPDWSDNLAEFKSRASGFVHNMLGTTQLTLTFTYFSAANKTVFDLLRNMKLNKTPAEFAIGYQDISEVDSEYLRIPGFLAEFPWDQAQDEVSSHDCSVALAYMEDANGDRILPSWETVSV